MSSIEEDADSGATKIAKKKSKFIGHSFTYTSRSDNSETHANVLHTYIDMATIH